MMSLINGMMNFGNFFQEFFIYTVVFPDNLTKCKPNVTIKAFESIWFGKVRDIFGEIEFDETSFTNYAKFQFTNSL